MTIWILSTLLALVVPSIVFAYRKRLTVKREEVVGILQLTSARESYTHVHRPLPARGEATDYSADELARRLFDQLYALRLYTVPTLLAAVVVFIASMAFWTYAGLALKLSPDVERIVDSAPSALIAALVGGYLWGLVDLTFRYRSIDMTPSSIHSMWLRLLLVAALGYFADLLVNQQYAAFVGFALGAFPLQLLRDFVRVEARKRTGSLGKATQGAQPDLYLLEGLTPDVIDRLSEEDVYTVQHLAFADPIKLFLRCNIPWQVILDIVDQALLCNYVGEKIIGLRSLHLRSALEIGAVKMMLLGVYDEIASDATEAERQQSKSKQGERGNGLATKIAKLLGQDEQVVHYLIDTIYYDDKVKLVERLWYSSFSGSRNHEPSSE